MMLVVLLSVYIVLSYDTHWSWGCEIKGPMTQHVFSGLYVHKLVLLEPPIHRMRKVNESCFISAAYKLLRFSSNHHVTAGAEPCLHTHEVDWCTILIHRVYYGIGPPFAATTASTVLGRLSTRFRCVFVWIFDHSSRSTFTCPSDCLTKKPDFYSREHVSTAGVL